MSVRHLAKGSSLPAFAGKLRVYSMKFCPYAQRLLLTMRAKELDYEIVNVNLTSKPEWLKCKSSFKKVPALEVTEGVTVYESLVACDYVEEKYIQNPLTSNDPLRRAHDKLIVEKFNRPSRLYYKLVFQQDDHDESDLFHRGMKDVQDVLISRNTKYIHGDDRPGMVDYMIWPWFERISLPAKFGGEKYALDAGKFKALHLWMDAMKADPVVETHFLKPEIHERFCELRMAGEDEYDFVHD